MKLLSPLQRLLLVFACVIVIYDVTAALAARQFGFDYSRFAPGSYTIQFAAGFFAVRQGSLNMAVLAGAMTGLVEATFGWALSAMIGPGRALVSLNEPALILGVIVFVVIVAGGLGLLGGGLGRVLTYGRRA